jgi:hypothetical protein
VNTDGSVQPAAFRFPTLAMTLLDLFPPGQALPGRLYGSCWHGRYPYEQCAQAPFPIDHPLGACILARRTMAAMCLADHAWTSHPRGRLYRQAGRRSAGYLRSREPGC